MKIPTVKGRSFANSTQSRFGAKPSPAPAPPENDADEDSLEDAAQEFYTSTESAFRQRARAEEQRLRDATDSEHWFAVCFHTRERKEEFLRKLAEKFGAVDGDKYVSGDELAAALGISLEARRPTFSEPRVKDWSRWTR